MKWELEQPKDKFYVPVITIKWLLILHGILIAVLALMTYGAWYL
ncbi:unnamed protein product [Commensalibacter communis]|nr:unnamed protein product [Commensalibacter communis]